MSESHLEKTCPRCAEQVKAAAQVCRFCSYNFQQNAAGANSLSSNSSKPPTPDLPKSYRLWGFVVAAVVVAGLIWAALGSSDTQVASPPVQKTSTDVEATEIAVPQDEANVIEAVHSAQNAYNSAPNDMAKGGTREMRRAKICAALGEQLTVDGWIGTIKKLSSNEDGKGVLEILIADDISVETWNNFLSDIPDNTLMDQRSEVFQQASRLKEGDKVRFSGSFPSSDIDCIKERSLTLDGSMQRPAFIFNFTSVKIPGASLPKTLPAENSMRENSNVPAESSASEGTVDAGQSDVSSDDAAKGQPEANNTASPPDDSSLGGDNFSPSFDCNKASGKAERIICADANLAKLDVQVSDLYRRARAVAADPGTVIADQRRWLDDRNACATENCLTIAYHRRKAELAQWVGPE